MKRVYLIVVLAAVLVFGTGMTSAYAQYDEIAWKTGVGSTWYTFVGNVNTSLDGDVLTVVYNAWPGYAFLETHVAVAGHSEGLAAIPHSKGGPTPGRFPYGAEHDPPVSQVTYNVNVAGMDRPLYVVAHCVVVRLSDGRVETGWTTGCTSSDYAFPGRNWARYFLFPSPYPASPDPLPPLHF